MQRHLLGYNDMSKGEVIEVLKSVHSKTKIPDSIDLHLKGGRMQININKPYLNMQEDDSAFEGWLVVLKYWLNRNGTRIDKIILGWDTSGTKDTKEWLHINRFLFRVMMFNRMKHMWFEINDKNKEEISAFETNLKKYNLILNGPKNEKSNIMDEGKDKKSSEPYLERLFAGEADKDRETKRLLIDRFNLSDLNRQLNVGLFIIPPDKKRNEYVPKKEDRLFPAGSSAIDLWGISNDNNTFYVFELKIAKNVKVGIVSELFFYLMIIYQACCIKDGFFNFTERVGKKDIRGSKYLVGSIYTNIKGYFLVNEMHPLVEQGVINILNDGLSQIGKIKVGILEYEYDGEKSESLRLK